MTNLPTLILIGGTGFTGKSILDHINQFFPCRVHIVSRGRQNISTHLWHNLEIHFHQLDISHPFNLNIKANFVIHAANSTLPHESNLKEHMDRVIIQGTKNVLEFIKQSQADHFMYLSSGAVYGLHHQSPVLMKENDSIMKPRENEYYRNGKLAAEKLCEQFFMETAIPTSIARCFTFSGHHILQHSHYAICNMLKQAQESKKIIIQGNGKATRSYLDQRDMAHWLLTILQKNSSFDTINIGSDEAISIYELAQLIGTYYQTEIEVLNNPLVNDNYYVPNLEKANSKYNLRPSIPIKESLKNMIHKSEA